MGMDFRSWIAQADEGEIMKVASALQLNFQHNLNVALEPFLEKKSEEEKKETSASQEEAAAAQMAAEPPAGTTLDQNPIAAPEGGTSKELMIAAIHEAISKGDLNGLAKVIEGVRGIGGDESAAQAISVAKQTMQDLLVSGQIQKEDVAALAQAFEAAGA